MRCGTHTHTHTYIIFILSNDISISRFHKGSTNYFDITCGYIFVISNIINVPLRCFFPNKMRTSPSLDIHPNHHKGQLIIWFFAWMSIYCWLLTVLPQPRYWQQCTTMPRNACFWTYVMTIVADVPCKATPRYKVLRLALELRLCLLLFYV